MTSVVQHDQAPLARFLLRYGVALGAGDVDAIANCWGVPAFIVSDLGIQTVTAKQVKAYFASAVAQYKARGFAAARAEMVHVEQLARTIVSVDVRWANLDGAGVCLTSEAWRYILKLPASEPPRIRVAIMKAGRATSDWG